eukprot:5915548-Ditylum_brightwellii.AAC.1
MSFEPVQQDLLGVVIVALHPPIKSFNKVLLPMYMYLSTQFYAIWESKPTNKIFWGLVNKALHSSIRSHTKIFWGTVLVTPHHPVFHVYIL